MHFPPPSSPAISGQVVIEGGPPTSTGSTNAARPLPHVHILISGTTANGATIVRHLTTNTRGRFAAALPNGTYTVTAITYGPATRALSTQPHKTVTTTDQKPITVKLISYVV